MSEVNPDKPCPFCGNTTVQTTVDDGCHWSSCPKCDATGPAEFLRSDEDSPGWNTRPDFDRVTAERDAALAELKRYQSLFNQAQKAIDRLNELHPKRMAELGRRLTAADERVDVLEVALRKIKARLDAYSEADMRMPESSVEVCQMIADAALKPAEGGGDE